MINPTQHDYLPAHQRRQTHTHTHAHRNTPPPATATATATTAPDDASTRSRLSTASRWTELDLPPAPSTASTPTRPAGRDPPPGEPPALDPDPAPAPARDPRVPKHRYRPAIRQREGQRIRLPVYPTDDDYPALQRSGSVVSATSHGSIIPRLIPFKRRGDEVSEKIAQLERDREAGVEKERLRGLKDKRRLNKQLEKQAKKKETEMMQEGLGVEVVRHGMMGRGATLLRRLSIGSPHVPAWVATGKGKCEAGDVQEVMKDDDERVSDQGAYQLPPQRPISPLIDTKVFPSRSPSKIKVKVGMIPPAWKDIIRHPISASPAAADVADIKGYKHYIQAGSGAVLPPQLLPQDPHSRLRRCSNPFVNLDFTTGSPLPPRPPKSPARRGTRITAESLIRSALPEHTPQGLPSRYRPNGVTIFDIYPDEDLDYHPSPPLLASPKTPLTPATNGLLLAPTRRAGGNGNGSNRANHRSSRVFAVPEALVALWEYGLDDPDIADMSLDEAELTRRRIAPMFVHYRSTGKLPPREMTGYMSFDTCTTFTPSRLPREQEKDGPEMPNVLTVAVSPPSTERSVSSKGSVGRASIRGSVGTASRVSLRYEMPHAHRRYSAASTSTGLFPNTD